MNWKTMIALDPEVMVGKPVIAGTRLTVEFIIERLASGDSVEEIVEQYEVTTEQIRACHAYAAEALEEVQIYSLPMARRG
jgi:uncharacterized protein (DUF433 family)